jgi:hypothetical protein
LLLAVQAVTIAPGWLDRRRVRIRCEACAEGVTYGRERRVASRVLCRACSGDAYYVYDACHNVTGPGSRTMGAIDATTEREGG